MPHPDPLSASSRRGFVKTAAAVSALAAVSTTTGQQSPAKRRKPLRIGAMCVGDGSFWAYSWGDILSPGKPVNKETLGTDVLDMEVTHVWDLNPKNAEKFAAIMGAETVRTYDDMVGRVDAVMMGGFYEIPWQHRLMRPYLSAGMPVYLGRPFAYSLRDIDTMLDLAAKHSAPVIATDLYEHIHGVQALKGKLEDLGDIECVLGTVLTGEYTMRFHTQFMLPKIFGFGIKRVAVFTDNPDTSTYLTGTYLYPASEGKPPFTCALSMTALGDLYSFTVAGTKGIETQRLPQFTDWRTDLMVHHLPQLIDMQRTFQGTNYEPLDLVRKKTELFLTGFYSASERGGAPVDVGSVPVDWRAAPARPGWVDEKIFK